ncbi:MAG: alpha-amylase family glycosyl hydrolase, partial [Spirochaeta sp.]|nr:alpha-amylase family glycosyl hydrolase [Spirochaeta sp.]
MNTEHTPAPDGVIYHIYPLGAIGAAHDRQSPAEGSSSISELAAWIPHMHSLGADAVLLGPVFSSETHGYDVLDPYAVDPRLGSAEELTKLVDAFHEAGIAVLLDAVMNHVGRDFFAFQDVLTHGSASRYADWFHGLDFSSPGPNGESFTYATWDGHTSLIKLNVENEEVAAYLLGAVSRWITEWGIDGLRLDAADVIAPSFWPRLRGHVDALYHPPVVPAFGNGRFWLFGEMVHGDYRQVASPDSLDGATNYEAYKGMYSSFNDGNMFEIAWSLQREFGPDGVYKDLTLYNFVDNHDVPRIASTLTDRRDLYPLHIMLFMIPGVPSIYYGSEAAIAGEKGIDDWPLRPRLLPEMVAGKSDLLPAIRRLSQIRHALPALG